MILVDGLADILSKNITASASIVHDTYGRPENQNQIETIYRTALKALELMSINFNLTAKLMSRY